MPRDPRTYRGEPSRDELVAAQQVVDMFASEALLALDRFERSFPATATDRERQVADRLAYWWQKLELDEVRPDPRGSDAEQILGAAADLSRDPENQWGVSIEYASAYAANLAVMEGRMSPVTTVADLRTRFEEAYGGQASEPERADDWLGQSLTRLGRASVLRDVIAEGARVGASEALHEAADELVRQGQRLMDDRRELAVQQEVQPENQGVRWHARNFAAAAAYGWTMTAADSVVTYAAMNLATGFYAVSVWNERRDQRTAFEHRLDPAQAQLRSVRTDLINNLDEVGAVTRRNAGALRNSNRPTGPSR
ncbi:hypothetical protein [Kribbella speibonae]|uniref:Uncharacterized protein n=1 Tax=Kribbella speibonae TaxID=1572660 RepID=A0A4R0ICL2_9ACTN|nr:hypothetical protein [Kribbella speibonae]TCC30119.1 hypothetical protein E0H92_39805 [Kribbella speibonae]